MDRIELVKGLVKVILIYSNILAKHAHTYDLILKLNPSKDIADAIKESTDSLQLELDQATSLLKELHDKVGEANENSADKDN